MSEPAELLPWDSEHFGLRIARVAEGRLDRERLSALDAWCDAHRVDCLYLLADSQDDETLAQAQAAGFLMVDLRLTLDRAAPPPRAAVPAAPETPSGVVRLARPDDLADLRPIARRGHTDSRFYFDRRFPAERCDALYDRWITRSVEGWADAVLVAEMAGRAAGYLTCHRGESGVASIGLVGVAPAARGNGLGGRLVQAALAWFAAEGAEGVEVVTQGRNVGAQRLYQACGFRTSRAGVWFHRWRRERRGGEAA